ncbi:6-bladed beta-propeller [Bacteroidales bacterium OttesenSCG-928-L03]|nr:6-bladed beta-propeller [Bacteroidales bacterium OttesenSCG-928-L03]
MKHVISLIAIFFSILTFSCKDQKEKLENTESTFIKIDLDGKLEKKNIEDIASAINFVILEEDEEYPIGEIDKLLISKNNIYVLDGYKSKSLYIYDKEGNLKKTIHDVGYGPGEYISLSDFDIDQRSNTLCVLDGNQRKLLSYSTNGDFISELNLNRKNFHINRIAISKNEDIVLDRGNSSTETYLEIIEKDGQKKAALIDVPEEYLNITISPRHPLQKYGDTILYMPSLNPSIYNVINNEAILRYQIDFGKYWPSDNYFETAKSNHPLKIAQGLVKDNYAGFLNFIETKDILHLNFEYNGKISYYKNKHSGKTIMFYHTDEQFDFPITADETSFICVAYREDGSPALIFFDIDWSI